jgi:hypothetical protein
MGIKQDTEDSLKDFEFTKIDGQPTVCQTGQTTYRYFSTLEVCEFSQFAVPGVARK